MSKLNSKWLAGSALRTARRTARRTSLSAALATALLAGCGGGGGSDSPGGVGNPGAPVPQASGPESSAQGVVDYLLALFARDTSELNEPIPTESVTFATEELAEPSPI